MPEPGNPQSLNRYSYVNNRPTVFTDPTGYRLEEGAGFAVCGGIGCIYPAGYPLAGYLIGTTQADVARGQAQMKTAVGTGVDFIPFIGDAKGLIEVFTGQDIISGEGLGHWRWLGLFEASELRHLRHADEVVQVTGSVIRKRIVIGEGMDAVKAAARQQDAKWYQAWGKNFTPEGFDLEKNLARNERWIRDKIRQGYEILDIGIDQDRSRRSLFYELERKILDELGYPTTQIERPF